MPLKVKKTPGTPLIGSGQKPESGGFDLKSIFGKKDKKEPGSLSWQEIMADKGNWLSNLDLGKMRNAWKRATINPAGSAIASTALAAGGAYLAAPWLAKGLLALRNKMPGVQPMDPSQIDMDAKTMRNRWALIAALLAGGTSLASNWDRKYPMQSLLKWDYANPGFQKQQADEYEEERNPLLKLAFMSNPDMTNQSVMSMDIIPLDHAKEVVANDPYLTSGQKAAIGTIFSKTPDQQGNASMADITAGAVRAGLGFAGGAIAGYALGKIFALPPSITRAASMTGGLANALRTSGLIT